MEIAWMSTFSWIEDDPTGFGFLVWSSDKMFYLTRGAGAGNFIKRELGIGYIKHSVYNEVRNRFGKEGVDAFIKAMQKGVVGPKGEQGIKRLAGKGITIGNRTYQYEIKVKSKVYGDWRIYGNYDEKLGKYLFDYFDKGFH